MQTAQLTLWARHDLNFTGDVSMQQLTASPRRQPCGCIPTIYPAETSNIAMRRAWGLGNKHKPHS
jgi:hypothetical protein